MPQIRPSSVVDDCERHVERRFCFSPSGSFISFDDDCERHVERKKKFIFYFWCAPLHALTIVDVFERLEERRFNVLFRIF